MITVATYHSENAKPEWIGFPRMPNGEVCWIKFEGNTEVDVIEKASTFMVAELERLAKLQSVLATPAPNGNHANIGKVWIVNRQTGDKRRVFPSEPTSYEAKGYVRGGPRSR